MIQIPSDVDKLLLERDLFAAIERLDQPRDHVNLLDLCNDHHLSFGEPGSTKRHYCQARWRNVKRANIRSYNYFLLQLRVTPSRSTRFELANYNEPSPFSTIASDDLQSKSQNGGKEAKPDDDAFMMSFENLSIENNKSKTNASSSLSPPQQKMIPPQQAPVPMTTTNNSSAFSPPRKQTTFDNSFGSPTHSDTSETDTSSMSSQWTEHTVLKPGATQHNPVPLSGDILKGEAEHFSPFNINRPGMKDDPTGKKEYKTVTIKRVVEPCDLMNHKMWIKTTPSGEQYLLTQEPSQSGSFHAVAAMNKGKLDSDQAKIQLENKRDIDADPNRQFRFCAIEVRGFKLDNSIFSGDRNNGLVKMDVDLVDFEKNGFKVKSTVVEWNIAVAGKGISKLQAEEVNPFAHFQAVYNAGV